MGFVRASVWPGCIFQYESENTMNASAIHKVEQLASLRDRIGESLSAAIISGELAPGTLVSVPTLAAQFEVSATPVREAMLDLEQRGFVVSVRNKGFRVTDVSEQDLKEILELRQMLEAPAMRALAANFPLETLPTMRAIADEISAHADNANLTGFVERDRDFHLGLLELYGNKHLVDMVRELRQQTRMVNLARMTQSSKLHDSAHEHHLMLDLLEKGDGEGLEELVVLHLGHVVGWWSGTPEVS
ncbi:GntR family transcriptional regulator [Leifsonia sp. A12D58]|uniref:GntR family transcriptional regulator n=1 Tax=Leifsonia sp. A12D58 TaxID=3397674 RepID=UPI0039E0B4AB